MSQVQIFADKVLAYDPDIPDYALTQCQIETATNTGGTCIISMPPGHPAYDLFPALRTEVAIYKAGKLHFRGRPLPLSEDTYGVRTIVCEGELCWFNDVVLRPYLYQADPASIFADIVAKYNAVVETWKQFKVGHVTATDPNDYVRLENQSAGSTFDALTQLVERCGGYIFFESDTDGTRTINWYAELPYACNQPVALGENLLSYAKEATLEQFATRVIPYGAADADGNRLTINIDGKDYIQDDAAVKLRGVIEATVTFDDITLEENLIKRAAQWLQEAKLIPETITLDAVDLSKMGLDFDGFKVGQTVEAISAPHGLSGYYGLTAMVEDLCDPRLGSITFGQPRASLIGSDVRADRQQQTDLNKVLDMASQAQGAAASAETRATHAETQATQNAQEIALRATSEEVDSKVSGLVKNETFEEYKTSQAAELSVMSDKVTIAVEEKVRQEVKSVDDELRALYNELRMNYDFTADGQYIGKKDSDTMLRLVNDMMQILVAGMAATTVDKTGLTADQANIKTLHMGSYTFAYGADGHLTLT